MKLHFHKIIKKKSNYIFGEFGQNKFNISTLISISSKSIPKMSIYRIYKYLLSKYRYIDMKSSLSMKIKSPVGTRLG